MRTLRTLTAFLALSLVAAPAAAEQVTIMSWNTEFLWDGRAPEDGQAAFAWKGDEAAADQRLDRVAQVIGAADPDIVVLLEIEDGDILSLLSGRLPVSGYRPYFVQGRDTFTGQDIGILSRYRPVSISRFENRAALGEGDRTIGVSKNIVAGFKVSRTPFALIAVHLRSGVTDPVQGLAREGQASALSEVLQGLSADGWPLILLGDFNDFDNEVRDAGNNTPSTMVLATVKRSRRPQLRNAMDWMRPADRWTTWFDRNGNRRPDRGDSFSAIDHILLDQLLADRILAAGVIHTDATSVSDHKPLFVRLDLP